MNRRSFVSGVACAVAGLSAVPTSGEELNQAVPLARPATQPLAPDALLGFTPVCSFAYDNDHWNVLEDLRTRDGAIAFVRADGRALLLARTAEACFATANPPYLGLAIKDIGLSGPDLLADHLLAHGGDPDPEQVRAAAPPMESASGPTNEVYGGRLPWNTFVGTRQCSDTMPVFPAGSTRTYHPVQFFSELTAASAHKRFEGLVGRWMPAVRKVFPAGDSTQDNAYYEVIVFGDVEAEDRFIVQTWHRTAFVQNGNVSRVAYGYSYAPFPPSRQAPSPEEFYRALLVFASSWQAELQELATLSVPDTALADLTRHAFAKEIMVRPGGVYPKYGAVDRDYYGSEYDGFQDIFTSSLFANLEWGRFGMARDVLDNYFTSFVDDSGNVNMRGPETAQFGLTLELLARYFRYTGDRMMLRKHRQKIEATVALLLNLHDASLRLAPDDPGYGLIAGWDESDSCLMPDPSLWWKPYYANSAFAARGLSEIAAAWTGITGSAAPAAWSQHSQQLKDSLTASVTKHVRKDMHPPYLGTYPVSGPDAEFTFRESMKQAHKAHTSSSQQWPHRAYAELLQADMLPPEDANLVIDCMRAYGATSIGVVANVGLPDPQDRAILGFISYGYAQMLLRLDRIEEYLLFLYAHRYHDHNPGSWTAGEVAGIDGSAALFCIPAQLTIPLLVRWMLIAEFASPMQSNTEAVLYLGRAIPRAWFDSSQPINIEHIPTQWGRVSYRTELAADKKSVRAVVLLEHSVPEIHVRFRLPDGTKLSAAFVNDISVPIAGREHDTVILKAMHGQVVVRGELA